MGRFDGTNLDSDWIHRKSGKEMVITHNEYHAGDNLIFLHLLRALALREPQTRFRHYGHAGTLAECAPVVADIPNVELVSFGADQWQIDRDQSVNTWKNAEDQWVKSPNRWSWSDHALEHHAWTAKRMGLRSPFTCREHLLFDYPALNPKNIGGSYFYDFLFVNSKPCSGQFKPMAEHGSGYLNDLIQRLAKKYSVITTDPVFGVECTRNEKKTLTDIGTLSLFCRHHIMVATGPMWPTINTTNHHHSSDRKRIVLLDNGEHINMPGIQQIATLAELEKIAQKAQWN